MRVFRASLVAACLAALGAACSNSTTTPTTVVVPPVLTKGGPYTGSVTVGGSPVYHLFKVKAGEIVIDVDQVTGAKATQYVGAGLGVAMFGNLAGERSFWGVAAVFAFGDFE